MLAYHFVNAIVTVSHTCYSYCCSTVYNMRQVPDFRIYVYYSSCNYLFFGLILAPLLSLSIFWHFYIHRVSRKRWRRKGWENETEKEKITWTAEYTEIVQSSWTIRLASWKAVLKYEPAAPVSLSFIQPYFSQECLGCPWANIVIRYLTRFAARIRHLKHNMLPYPKQEVCTVRKCWRFSLYVTDNAIRYCKALHTRIWCKVKSKRGIWSNI